MDSAARYRLFTVGMIAIEQNDAHTVSVVHSLLKPPLFDQPHFIDADVSAVYRDGFVPFGVPPSPEVHSISSDSSQPDSYQPEAWSDSSFTCVDTRP